MTTSTTNSNNNASHSLFFNNEQTSPIVHQPQSVKSTGNLSSSNSSTSAASSPSPSVNKTSTQNVITKNECKNIINKVNSVSYLDESNLKLAIIDYSDILKLIKLQNSIEYQEWIAFNSKFYY